MNWLVLLLISIAGYGMQYVVRYYSTRIPAHGSILLTCGLSRLPSLYY